MHLINSIIATGKYPKILKMAKISPNLKPDKDYLNIESYRPINNLTTLYKLIE